MPMRGRELGVHAALMPVPGRELRVQLMPVPGRELRVQLMPVSGRELRVLRRVTFACLRLCKGPSGRITAFSLQG